MSGEFEATTKIPPHPRTSTSFPHSSPDVSGIADAGADVHSFSAITPIHFPRSASKRSLVFSKDPTPPLQKEGVDLPLSRDMRFRNSAPSNACTTERISKSVSTVPFSNSSPVHFKNF
ncbi:hypothetical protein NPIL_120561 [Nephila pilipes]|uniref:Uncharacterized protein n=1 Tax=Nephila pilipes TaxID=299642 RepID=A0A8X6T671_NEPPI|nr:hypothetical protein NPIL_120561 [Nephila pilipes]